MTVGIQLQDVCIRKIQPELKVPVTIADFCHSWQGHVKLVLDWYFDPMKWNFSCKPTFTFSIKSSSEIRSFKPKTDLAEVPGKFSENFMLIL